MERHHNRYKVRNYICLVKSSVEYKFQSLILYGEALAMQRGGSILLEMNLCIVARSPNSGSCKQTRPSAIYLGSFPPNACFSIGSILAAKSDPATFCVTH